MLPVLDIDRLSLTEILRRRSLVSTEIDAAVDQILQNVQTRGDQALLAYTEEFDGVKLEQLEVTPEEWSAALKSIEPGFRETLEMAAENIRKFHTRQLHQDFVLTDRPGIVMGQRYTPIHRVGVCVPSAPEAFPSTVLMSVIPARIAGVKEIFLVTPPGTDGHIGAGALAAAKIAGADRVFCIGGAQGVAALAYGTQTIPRVDKIVGPGGAYVAAAKRKVFGQVGIDMIAGPSEIVILADKTGRPDFIAADLLSQAEHDPLSSAILLTDNKFIAYSAAMELDRQLARLPRQDVAGRSLEANGKIIYTDDLRKAVNFVNEIAPEHLELCVEEPFALLPQIQNAGSIFLGHYAPEALGDYFAGPNHTLPTNGTARFSSPLGVDDFRKRSSFLYYHQDELKKAAEYIADFAGREGLEAHAHSVRIRTVEKKPEDAPKIKLRPV